MSVSHIPTGGRPKPGTPNKSAAMRRRANAHLMANDLLRDETSPVNPEQRATDLVPSKLVLPAESSEASPCQSPRLKAPQASDDHRLSVPSAVVVARMVQLWRMRQRWHRAEKSLILQGRAICRSFTEGDKDKANELFDTARAGGNIDAILFAALFPFHSSIDKFKAERLQLEKTLKEDVAKLPAWEWVKACRGFGALNYAGIIGEAGDLNQYDNPAKVWKRMGLAVIDGIGQSRRSNAEQALQHGFSPARRAVAFNLSDCLIRADSPYKKFYEERKAATLASERGWTPIHAHRDAARYMVKRVLRDLWRQWRDEK